MANGETASFQCLLEAGCGVESGVVEAVRWVDEWEVGTVCLSGEDSGTMSMTDAWLADTPIVSNICRRQAVSCCGSDWRKTEWKVGSTKSFFRETGNV